MAHSHHNRYARANVRAEAMDASGATKLNAALAAVVFALLAAYLALNNGVTEKGFAMRATRASIADLEEERQRLDIAVVSSQSMDSIGERVGTMGFVPVQDMQFVDARESVAVR